MAGFDYKRLKSLRGILDKEAQFVPMDPAAAGGGGGMPPGAGGPPPPDGGDGGGAPMDPSMMDPSMMDPAMAGGGMPPGPPPMDPSGLPPPTDSSGGEELSPDGEPYIKITWKQLLKMLEQVSQLNTKINSQGAEAAPAPAAAASSAGGTDNTAAIAELNAKLDAVMPMIASLSGGGGIG